MKYTSNVINLVTGPRVFKGPSADQISAGQVVTRKVQFSCCVPMNTITQTGKSLNNVLHITNKHPRGAATQVQSWAFLSCDVNLCGVAVVGLISRCQNCFIRELGTAPHYLCREFTLQDNWQVNLNWNTPIWTKICTRKLYQSELKQICTRKL